MKSELQEQIPVDVLHTPLELQLFGQVKTTAYEQSLPVNPELQEHTPVA